MIEKDLDKVLNYMKQYVENKYEHDSEPMLNWKDLKLILEEIERLNNIIKRLEEFIEKEIELYTLELTEENTNKLSIVAPIRGVYKEIYNVLQELKGEDKE